MRTKQRRTQSGTSLAELGASMALILPLIILVLFITLEAAHAYLIKNALNDATRQAARDFAKVYESNLAVADDRGLQESLVLSKIHIPNMIVTPAQFEVAFNEGASPPNVSVTARYEGGKWGLPPYPTIDPLHLGRPCRISCQSVYRLE